MISVCTCAEGCEPRTTPEKCPTHAQKYSVPAVTTTNGPNVYVYLCEAT